MKINRLKESLSDNVLLGELNMVLSQFETVHQFKTGLSKDVQLSEQEFISVKNLLEKWKQQKQSKNNKDMLATEASIIKLISRSDKSVAPNKSTVLDADSTDVPTVERKRNNIKTFQEMQQEAFSSPFTSFKNKAKNDIKSKVCKFATQDQESSNIKKDSKPKSAEQALPKGTAYKPDRRNINALKAEISSKMQELDVVFSQDTQTVVAKAEEVKQLLEKLNYLLRQRH